MSVEVKTWKKYSFPRPTNIAQNTSQQIMKRLEEYRNIEVRSLERSLNKTVQSEKSIAYLKDPLILYTKGAEQLKQKSFMTTKQKQQIKRDIQQYLRGSNSTNINNELEKVVSQYQHSTPLKTRHKEHKMKYSLSEEELQSTVKGINIASKPIETKRSKNLPDLVGFLRKKHTKVSLKQLKSQLISPVSNNHSIRQMFSQKEKATSIYFPQLN